jgi:hypothetical protein
MLLCSPDVFRRCIAAQKGNLRKNQGVTVVVSPFTFE